MAVPRVVGAHGNVIKKLIYDIPGNFLTRTKEKFKKTVAAVSNIYSNPHFPYE